MNKQDGGNGRQFLIPFILGLITGILLTIVTFVLLFCI